MRTHPGIMTNSEVNGNFDLRVYRYEKKDGFFIIYPVGAINASTSPILRNEVEQIFLLKPEIIMFDMKQVNYINSKGLRVILKVHQAMKSRGGRIILMNFQPHIKKVFDIIDALPKQRIFANRYELDNYLDTMQKRYLNYTYLNEFEAGTDNYKFWKKSNYNQSFEMSSRM